MNAATAPEQCALSLVEIIDFTWLMAGDGHRVHVEQLQRDPAYARDCLALAARSHIQALREAGQRLSRLLDASASH